MRRDYLRYIAENYFHLIFGISAGKISMKTYQHLYSFYKIKRINPEFLYGIPPKNKVKKYNADAYVVSDYMNTASVVSIKYKFSKRKSFFKENFLNDLINDSYNNTYTYIIVGVSNSIIYYNELANVVSLSISSGHNGLILINYDFLEEEISEDELIFGDTFIKSISNE